MNILVLGSGGREHALAWKIRQSPKINQLYVAPGNAGTASLATNLPLSVGDFPSIKQAVLDKGIDLVLVGPEVPLVEGISDYFLADPLLSKIPVIGPSKEGARLEGSKEFAKEFMARHGIPTAAYRSFGAEQLEEAFDFLKELQPPYVLKADGLAAGKGVILAQTEEQAISAVQDMLAGNAFGEAGHRVVIEEFLDGEEASFIVMADGEHVLPMATSQDHKRVGDGDTGPNTGGMGAYSPAPVVSDTVYRRIMDEVIMPTVAGMAAEGLPYTGFLYAGLMIMPDGTPKVIEYNCRFGDPETQPIMLRMRSDLVVHCITALDGKLDEETTEWDERCSLGVVMAAGGYPGDYRTGDPISGLPDEASEETKVFHAGTRMEDEKVVTAGGRVLCVTALGRNVSEAQQKAYALVDTINWDDAFCRRDIGYRAIAREQS